MLAPYEPKFSVSEVSKYISASKADIKNWSRWFSDYLSPEAQPSQGEPRNYSISDVAVLAYVSYQGVADGDLEEIKFGLNSRSLAIL